MTRYIATFHPQIWQGDYAIEVFIYGSKEWDCTDDLAKLPAERRRELLAVIEAEPDDGEGALDGFDLLRQGDSAPVWVRNWPGPFDTYVRAADKDETSTQLALTTATGSAIGWVSNPNRRTPDEILTDYDAGAKGTADIDMRSILWEVLDDVCSTYDQAMENAGVAEDLIDTVNIAVGDYLTNHYGDD